MSHLWHECDMKLYLSQFKDVTEIDFKSKTNKGQIKVQKRTSNYINNEVFHEVKTV